LVTGFGSVLAWSWIKVEVKVFWGGGLRVSGSFARQNIFLGAFRIGATPSTATERGKASFSTHSALKRRLSVALVNVVKHILSHLL